MRLSLSLAVACLALAGCASQAGGEPKPKGVAKYEDDPRLGKQVDKICFAANIDSFGNTTRDTLTVREGRDHYLIEIFGSCLPLDRAMTVAIDTSTSCLRKGDHIIVSDSLPGSSSGAAFSTQRCLVNAMYEWDPKAKPDTEDEKADEENEAPAEES